MSMGRFSVWTDGACSGNPGPGGWAFIIEDGNGELVKKDARFGGEVTTNQKMELQAVIEGLKVIEPGSTVTVYSDSAYVINCFKQEWYKKWMYNGWTTATGGAVQNKEQWEELIELARHRKVSWIKVKGHSGNPLNTAVDQMAVAARLQRYDHK